MDNGMQKEGQKGKKLGIFTLTTLVVGAIIGSGIFSLPQNMAQKASAAAILIAWIITFIGMFSLTKLFEWLSLNRQDIEDGVYGYAKKGFGNYMGFNAAWGYWFSVWIGCGVGYMVMFFSTLGTFEAFSFFGKGDTPQALICELIIVWAVHFFVLRGVQNAAIVNAFMTAGKIVPIVVFLIFGIAAFNMDTFKLDFFGSQNLENSLLDQVRSTMLFTVWVFLGIECATVYATRAKDAKTVSKATVTGFLLTFLLLSGVSIVSLGVVPQTTLATMDNPSMIGVMAATTEMAWPPMLIKIGVLISLAGAILAWTLICTEMLYLSGRGKDHTAPEVLGKLNKAGAPKAALLLTNIFVTILLIYNALNATGYNKLIQLASSMALIPYWLCAAFGLTSVLKSQVKKNKTLMTIFALIGCVYSTWLIYAGGMDFLLLSMILYAPGLLFFAKASKEKKEPLFKDLFSKCMAIIVLGLALVALYLLFTGSLEL